MLNSRDGGGFRGVCGGGDGMLACEPSVMHNGAGRRARLRRGLRAFLCADAAVMAFVLTRDLGLSEDGTSLEVINLASPHCGGILWLYK